MNSGFFQIQVFKCPPDPEDWKQCACCGLNLEDADKSGGLPGQKLLLMNLIIGLVCRVCSTKIAKATHD